MEKNLAENSGDFARSDEHEGNENAGDAPPSPMTDPTESEPKPEAEAETEPEQEPPKQGDEEREEKKEEESSEIVPPDSPTVSMEKASEDIDNFLATLPQDDNGGNKNDGGNDEDWGKDDASFEIPVFVDKFLDLVDEKIAMYDSGEGKPKEDSSLLEAVKRISSLMKYLQSHRQPESLMNRVGLIQQRAMSYLEEDFRLLMEESRNPVESDMDHKGKHVAAEQPPQENSDQSPAEPEPDFPGYSEESIARLSRIAAEMIAGGYQSECCQVYMLSRRHAFEEILQKLGFEKVSIDEIQKMQWETLARDMIPAWINTLKQCSAVYFPGERRLAEAVFADQPSISAGVFSNLSRGVVIQLLNFAEGAAMTRRACDKLFKILDMYETLRDVIPKVDEIFPEDFVVEELKTEMNLAKSRLGETAISMFCDLEHSIKVDTAKTPVPGGAVHPLTRWTMNYMNTTGDYKETMEQVFKEHSKIERADSTSRQHHHDGNEGSVKKESDKDVSSPFAAQVTRLMELLDSSLDAKARLYKDVALSNFFMMNNGRYILQKIKGSNEMCQVMGDTWCRKRSSELRTYHKNYQRETWNRVLQCLSHEGLSSHGKVQKPILKERFKSFNALFDEIHRTQSSWVVKDEQLQSELRVSISAVVIPAYRSFLGRFSQVLDPGRQTEKYIKYQPEDIETYIDELFDGKPHQSIARRKT